MEEPTQEELFDACGSFGEKGDLLESVYENVEDTWRHGVTMFEVFYRAKDNTHWGVSWRQDTNCDWHGLRENDYSLFQVRPVEVTTIEYKPVS